ncbi:hypothetical protein KEM55_006095 [Ascosphaera atra]|nr:hypothetical protein KEM55_006095 [Ascosphaera atra]
MLQNNLVPPWKHVYRALLREASYLPDPIARRYMRSYILDAYHYHYPRLVSDRDSAPQSQVSLEKQARQFLSVLKRANEGYLKPLEKVLLLSYGRTGRRRYELLEPYFGAAYPDKPKDRRDAGPPRRCPKTWSPSESLLALISSQALNPKVKEAKVVPVIRETKPPGKKAYRSGRPILPLKLMQKWYESMLDRVLPPLPGDEWNVLHGLIVGTEPWTRPERRKRVNANVEATGGEQPLPLAEDAPDENAIALGTKYLEDVELNTLSPEFLVFGPEKGQTFRPYIRGRPHNLRRRVMAKLWDRVIEQVPRLEYNAEATAEAKAGWIVRWGRPAVEAPIYYTVERDLADFVFGDIGKDGRKVRQMKNKRREEDGRKPGEGDEAGTQKGSDSVSPAAKAVNKGEKVKQANEGEESVVVTKDAPHTLDAKSGKTTKDKQRTQQQDKQSEVGAQKRANQPKTQSVASPAQTVDLSFVHQDEPAQDENEGGLKVTPDAVKEDSAHKPGKTSAEQTRDTTDAQRIQPQGQKAKVADQKEPEKPKTQPVALPTQKVDLSFVHQDEPAPATTEEGLDLKIVPGKKPNGGLPGQGSPKK